MHEIQDWPGSLWLKSLRQQAEMTLTALSQETGIAVSSLSHYERGTAKPNHKNLARLTLVLAARDGGHADTSNTSSKHNNAAKLTRYLDTLAASSLQRSSPTLSPNELAMIQTLGEGIIPRTSLTMVPALDGSGLTLQVNRDHQPIGRLGLSLQRRIRRPFVLRYRPLGRARGVIVVLSTGKAVIATLRQFVEMADIVRQMG